MTDAPCDKHMLTKSENRLIRAVSAAPRWLLESTRSLRTNLIGDEPLFADAPIPTSVEPHCLPTAIEHSWAGPTPTFAAFFVNWSPFFFGGQFGGAIAGAARSPIAGTTGRGALLPSASEGAQAAPCHDCGPMDS